MATSSKKRLCLITGIGNNSSGPEEVFGYCPVDETRAGCRLCHPRIELRTNKSSRENKNRQQKMKDNHLMPRSQMDQVLDFALLREPSLFVYQKLAIRHRKRILKAISIRPHTPFSQLRVTNFIAFAELPCKASPCQETSYSRLCFVSLWET